ncbi:hypothetical protein ACFWGE_09315 [Streptomyces bacillaris]|uniref:hypothetical protein n=1 Tax=Streptomyces bacillaris TaxID=68179 RepID=UPI00363A8501
MISPSEIIPSALLSRWLDPASADMVDQEELPPGLPNPLREWYTLTSHWPDIRSAGTRILKPSRIQLNENRVAFMEDPTGDWTWAFDSNHPNVVYEGESNSTLTPGSEDLQELLAHVTVRSIILLANSSRLGTQVPDEVLPEILSPMEAIGFGGWKWPRPGYRVHAAESLLAEVGPAIDPQAPWLNRTGYSTVRIAGLGGSDLTYLDSHLPGTWIDTGINSR